VCLVKCVYELRLCRQIIHIQFLLLLAAVHINILYYCAIIISERRRKVGDYSFSSGFVMGEAKGKENSEICLLAFDGEENFFEVTGKIFMPLK
jgi:hypothetical protein